MTCKNRAAVQQVGGGQSATPALADQTPERKIRETRHRSQKDPGGRLKGANLQWGASSGDSGHGFIVRSPAGGLQSAGLARFVVILRFPAVFCPQKGLQSLARGLHS